MSVKGSKQFQMMVVPHRPYYKVMIFMTFLVALGAFSWVTFEYGKRQGLALKVEVVRERDRIRSELEESHRRLDEMGQEIADLKVGGRIDDQANEEVRETIESLQEQIAEMNEEISFYKGVMLPNVANRGLRIERLDLSETAPNRVRYSLLLTQIVDKHDFVQGDVTVSLAGRESGEEKQYPLQQLDSDKSGALRFRFRYFQNINGEMQLPEGFEPREVMILAQSSGSNGQTLEKSFNWSLNGG